MFDYWTCFAEFDLGFGLNTLNIDTVINTEPLVRLPLPLFVELDALFGDLQSDSQSACLSILHADPRNINFAVYVCQVTDCIVWVC